jgi:hypothetical protein
MFSNRRHFLSLVNEGFGPRLVALVAIGWSVACSSSSGPKPVPECMAYQTEIARCTGRDMPFAAQPAALASTDDERVRLAAVCRENLARVQAACR